MQVKLELFLTVRVVGVVAAGHFVACVRGIPVRGLSEVLGRLECIRDDVRVDVYGEGKPNQFPSVGNDGVLQE